jgi:hypothetical protein
LRRVQEVSDDAVSELGAAAVDVRESSGDGSAVGAGDAEGTAAGAREAQAPSAPGPRSAAHGVAVGQEWADGLNPGDRLVVEEVDSLDRAVLTLCRGAEVVAEDFMRWPVNRWRALVEMQRLELLS